eukprot:gene18738-19042_t
MLTDIEARKAKPSTIDRKLNDGSGLYLMVRPNGSKLWRFDFSFAGKRKTLSFGSYPDISISDARRMRDEAKTNIKSDVDPSQKRKLDKLNKAASHARTFGLISAELLQKKKDEGLAKATLEKLNWLFGLVADDLNNRPISEVSPPEILAILKRVEARGKLETAKRLRAVTGEVFRYAIQTGRATNDPTVALRGALRPPKVTHRAAITEPAAVGQLLRAIDSYPSADIRGALQLMAICFPRPGELCAAEWEEFDLDQAIWMIPEARTKMRRPHKVPLPAQALNILKELRILAPHSKFVFPSNRSQQRCISEAAMNAALRRLGYASDEMQPYGFRSIASTLLNESGKFSADAIERALAHQDADSVRRAYARGAYWQERVNMAQWWADYLDTLRGGAKIIPMRKA